MILSQKANVERFSAEVQSLLVAFNNRFSHSVSQAFLFSSFSKQSRLSYIDQTAKNAVGYLVISHFGEAFGSDAADQHFSILE